MSRPAADPVARMIAQTVQHHLITSPERPDLPALPAEVTAVEAHAVGELDTGIAVTTADRGVRTSSSGVRVHHPRCSL